MTMRSLSASDSIVPHSAEEMLSVAYKQENELNKWIHQYTRTARHLTESDREDIYSQILIKIGTRWKQYSGDGPIGAWFRQIVHSTCLDALRKKSPMLTAVGDELSDQPTYEPDTSELELKVQDAIRARVLPADAYPFFLLLCEGLDNTDIAERLGMTVNAAASARGALYSVLRSKQDFNTAPQAGNTPVTWVKPSRLLTLRTTKETNQMTKSLTIPAGIIRQGVSISAAAIFHLLQERVMKASSKTGTLVRIKTLADEIGSSLEDVQQALDNLAEKGLIPSALDVAGVTSYASLEEVVLIRPSIMITSKEVATGQGSLSLEYSASPRSVDQWLSEVIGDRDSIEVNKQTYDMILSWVKENEVVNYDQGRGRFSVEMTVGKDVQSILIILNDANGEAFVAA